MALRFSCKDCSIAVAGTTIAHGLASTPDEWHMNIRGASGAMGPIYVVSAPTSTSIIVAASGAAAKADVFVACNHSLIQ